MSFELKSIAIVICLLSWSIEQHPTLEIATCQMPCRLQVVHQEPKLHQWINVCMYNAAGEHAVNVDLCMASHQATHLSNNANNQPSSELLDALATQQCESSHHLNTNELTRGVMTMYLQLGVTPLSHPDDLGTFSIAFIKEVTRGPGKATFSIMFIFSTLTGCFLTPFFFKC